MMNDISYLVTLSSSLHVIHDLIFKEFHNYGMDFVEYGGDEGLIKFVEIPSGFEQRVKKIWMGFGLSVTVGFGDTIKAAFEDCRNKKAQLYIR